MLRMNAFLSAASAPATTGMMKSLGGQPGLHLGRDEGLDEVDCLLGRALAHDPADDPAKRIGRRSLSAGHDGELEPADLIVREAPFLSAAMLRC